MASSPATRPLHAAGASERYAAWLMTVARSATPIALRCAGTIAFGVGLVLGFTALGAARAGPLFVVAACATAALVGLEKHASP